MGEGARFKSRRRHYSQIQVKRYLRPPPTPIHIADRCVMEYKKQSARQLPISIYRFPVCQVSKCLEEFCAGPPSRRIPPLVSLRPSATRRRSAITPFNSKMRRLLVDGFLNCLPMPFCARGPPSFYVPKKCEVVLVARNIHDAPIYLSLFLGENSEKRAKLAARDVWGEAGLRNVRLYIHAELLRGGDHGISQRAALRLRAVSVDHPQFCVWKQRGNFFENKIRFPFGGGLCLFLLFSSSISFLLHFSSSRVFFVSPVPLFRYCPFFHPFLFRCNVWRALRRDEVTQKIDRCQEMHFVSLGYRNTLY